MKSVIVGAVESTKILLESMLKTNFPVQMVFSLDEQYSANVSGYYPLHRIAIANDIPHKTFKNINDLENINLLRQIEPDYIFVVGLSQLVKKELMDCAQRGVIGFHPTPLPKFRGRAAIVWQILLGVNATKCSMFLIDDGMDSGDLLGQEDYLIEPNDYACDVTEKCLKAAERLFIRVLPLIQHDNIVPVPQDESKATYLLKRTPEDGMIDWTASIKEIHTLIRAASKPYPGAFSNYDGKVKVIFWHANIKYNDKYIGIPGQIAYVDGRKIIIVCKDGLLEVDDYLSECSSKLSVGHKFK